MEGGEGSGRPLSSEEIKLREEEDKKVKSGEMTQEEVDELRRKRQKKDDISNQRIEEKEKLEKKLENKEINQEDFDKQKEKSLKEYKQKLSNMVKSGEITQEQSEELLEEDEFNESNTPSNLKKFGGMMFTGKVGEHNRDKIKKELGKTFKPKEIQGIEKSIKDGDFVFQPHSDSSKRKIHITNNGKVIKNPNEKGK